VANGLPSAPWQINTSTDPVEDDYALAVDRAGNAMALWKPDNTAAEAVVFRRFNAQTNAWGPVSPALSRDTVNPLPGDLRVDVSANGDATTAWIEYDTDTTRSLRVLTFR
jgi:hypothetical protein